MTEHPPIPTAPAGIDPAAWAEVYAEVWADAERRAERWATPADRAAWVAQEAVFLYRVDHPEVVDREEDLPVFATEGEEADYWETHVPSPALRRRLAARAAARRRTPPAPRKQASPVSLRLEADLVRRLRALAAKKGTKYQTLLKQFVVERLYEEERREGLLEAGGR
jgi:hypothetical protein